MAPDGVKYTIKVVGDLREVDQGAWDACANPALTDPACRVAVDPFVSYGFLSALEDSGSAAPETGWAPTHLLIEAGGEPVGVVPMYLKSHSRGEYIFDYSWAEAFERAGGRYYPKLIVCIPFTPATGRRLLTKPAGNVDEIEQYLLSGCMQVAEQMNVSSLHVNFAERDQWDRMGRLGFLLRTHKQFHWQNQGYESFDHFLADLSAKKRKNIRRERRDALADGVEIELVTGSDLRESHWDAFYRFYVDTGNRKWGTPYLTREFFSLIGARIPEQVLLIMCKRAGRYIAGAINFVGSECLFGRNWGCIEDHRFLHFEACYYQAIEYAINLGLQRVEAGAQGPHKLARGYLPSHTYSAHWIANRSFSDAVERFLDEERRYVSEEIDFIDEHRSPFRQREAE